MIHKLKTLGKLASVCGGSVAIGYIIANNGTFPSVSGSWTTNFTPSVTWDYDWDKRDPTSYIKPKKTEKNIIHSDANNNVIDKDIRNSGEEELNKHRSTATRYIIMVRHGQYNLQGVTDEQRNLTALGRAQARLTGERLKELNFPIKRLVYSTMTRATETAQIMMNSMSTIEAVESTDLLCEGAPIPPEPPVGYWKPERHFFTDGARIEAAFRLYFYRAPPSQTEDSYEILVCHANVIRYIVCRLLQLPPEAWLRMSLHNGSMTVVSIRPSGRCTLRQLGECGYMPPDSLSVT